MKAEEFKKYEGCKTTGKMMGYDLDGCEVVGYDPSDDDMCIIVKVLDKQGWTVFPGECKFATEKDLKDYKSGKYRYLYVKPEYVVTDVDLTSILKGCEGIELWSDICGACKLDKINKDGLVRVVVCETESIGLNFLRDGRFYDFEGAKCLLWPSETNRDWSTFKKPVRINDDDFVVGCNNPGSGFIDNYGEIDSVWKYIIRLEDWRTDLTEEELEKLNVNKT